MTNNNNMKFKNNIENWQKIFQLLIQQTIT